MDDRLKKIEERCNKATEGPWAVSDSIIHPQWFEIEDEAYRFQILGGGVDDDPLEGYAIVQGLIETPYEIVPKPDDLYFIAHAREDIPYLLDLLRKARYDEAQRASVRVCGLSPAQIQELILFATSHGWRHPGSDTK